MSEASRRTCLVYDHAGLYVHVALALAHGFKRVLYFSEWRDAFSTSKGRLVGDGFEEIERLRDFEDGLPDADVVVFPDMGRYGLQNYLRSQGLPVWGMGRAEALEDDKLFFHHWLLTQPSLEAPEMWQIEGVDALRRFLQKHGECFIKSNDRGDFETYHHRRWELSEPWFNDLVAKIGPYKDVIEIIAQDPVEGVEIGYDGYVIDGQYPPTAQIGFECKNKGYLGKLLPHDRLPPPLLAVCNAVGAWTQAEGFVARGMFSSEVRLKNNRVGYFIDPTMRFGIPPSACQSAAWQNWAEIIWHGARGELVDLECPYRYVAELELTSDWVDRHFMAVEYPAEYEGLVVLTRWHRFEGKNYLVPTGSLSDESANIGAAIGLGTTADEAVQMAKAVAESLEAYDISFDPAAFDKLDGVLEAYAKLGFTF